MMSSLYEYDCWPEDPGSDVRPTIVFLHGRGERGSNLSLVRTYGPPKLARLPTNYGLNNFIILSPQCPKGTPWSAELLSDFVDMALETLPVDRRRVYLTGLSMGAFGAWDLATAHPDKFTAVAILCGGGDPAKAHRLADTPVWLFHSAADQRVRVQNSDSLFDALRKVNAPVSYTRYKSLDHVGTWERVYASKMLYSWFLRAERSRAG